MASQKLLAFVASLLLFVVAMASSVAAQESPSPSPSMESASSFLTPAFGVILCASLLSFAALFFH
ncbi:hypothetical protein AMTRI_Chr04g185750 [Amborella trichopoda]